jgi:hypothetical protein
LAEKVDGATKGSLLEIAILLHDIGKYAARRLGRHRFHFTHHEILSGKIIREELQLESRGLSSAQIDYIALTAQDHFVLGLVRRRAREEGAYDEAYASSRSFAELVTQIVADHPQDYLEIGVLFLGDSLAKANPGEGPERALSQYDLNIDVARRYLQLALGN